MTFRTARRRGGAAIEFAVILPVLLMFLLGLLDCGRLLWTYTTFTRAVDAAARCAVVNATLCSSASAVQSYAVTQAWSLGLTTSAFTVTYNTASCGNLVAGTKVAGRMSFVFVIPWFYGTAPFGSSNSMTLTAVACYPR